MDQIPSFVVHSGYYSGPLRCALSCCSQRISSTMSEATLRKQKVVTEDTEARDNRRSQEHLPQTVAETDQHNTR